MSRNSRNPISWVPTVYFAMGLPFVVLNMVSVNNAGRSSYYYYEDHEDAGSSSKRKSKSGISRSKSKH